MHRLRAAGVGVCLALVSPSPYSRESNAERQARLFAGVFEQAQAGDPAAKQLAQAGGMLIRRRNVLVSYQSTTTKLASIKAALDRLGY